MSVTRPFDSSPAFYYKRSIVTMRLSCTVMEIWRLKDNGGHEFDLLGSCDIIGHVTIRLPRSYPRSKVIMRLCIYASITISDERERIVASRWRHSLQRSFSQRQLHAYGEWSRRLLRVESGIDTHSHWRRTATDIHGSTVAVFASCSSLYVRKTSSSCTASAKQSSFDSTPTWLLKDCVDLLAPYLTHLFNESLSPGCVPDLFKVAYITPLLKKPGTDVDAAENYWPVSNLSVLSKTLECAVTQQLKS